MHKLNQMTEAELTKIWQSSTNQERLKFDKSRLLLELQSSMDHFHRKIKFRDIREQAIAIVMMPVFVYTAFTIPHVVSKVASGLIVVLAISLIVRIRAAKEYKPGDLTETYVNYLYKTREYLQIQKRMLDSLHVRFLLPSMILVFLFLSGFLGVPGKATSLVEASIANVVVHVVVFIIAKLDVQSQFVNRLEKVDELIKAME
jgi:hypothetical protein